MFFTNSVIADSGNPIGSTFVSARGQKSPFGWPNDPKIEELRDAFARAPGLAEQKKIAADIQQEIYDQVIYVPLGQWFAPSAWRKSITGMLEGQAVPVFWNVDKSE